MKDKLPVFWLIRRIHRRLPALLFMTAAHVIQALMGVYFALGTRQVIDCAVEGGRDQFFLACLRQGGIILTIMLCLTIYRHLKERILADLDWDWKERILHGLLHGDYASMSEYHSAELLNRMNNDIRTVNEGILTIIPNMLSMATRLIAVGAVLVVLDWKFSMLILLLGGTAIVLTGLLRRYLKELHKLVSHHDGIVSAFLQETIENLLMVQAMDVSVEMEHRAGELLERRYQVQRRRKNVSLAANTSVSVMYYGMGFLALLWCALRMMKGDLSFGSLTAITQLVGQLQAPFVGLSGIFPKYTAMVASAERLMELETIQREPEPVTESAESMYERMRGISAEALFFPMIEMSYFRMQLFRSLKALLRSLPVNPVLARARC